MPFGGFCPLPLRLGGTDKEGISAEQHARLAADLVALGRVASFATFGYRTASGTARVDDYSGQNGNGAAFAPEIDINGTGDIRFTWPTYFEDEYGVAHVIDIRAADVGSETGGATVDLSSNSIRVRSFNEAGVAEDAPFSVEVWGVVGQERLAIGDYDGDTEKTNCETERVPHAWTWYQDYTAMLGDGLSREQTGLVHAKKLALARFEAGKTRAVECALANNNPATADEILGQWVEVFRIPVSEDMTKWELRRRCAARLRGFGSAGFTAVDAAIRELLGEQLVQVFRTRGAALSAPPAITYWSENPGPPTLSLGGGAWMSSRAHLVVQVRQPGYSEARFLRLMNVDLFDLLDRRLPAWMTFNWTAWTDDGAGTPGFRLDISRLDFEGLGA